MAKNLQGQARDFAAQTSDLLNRTLTKGIRISSVTTPVGHTVMGCGVTPKNLMPTPIPLGTASACVWLYLQHSYGLDPEGVHLTMTQGTISLYSSVEMGDDDLLLGIDYVRESPNQYPGSHLHVAGVRGDLDRVYRGDQRKSRKLRDLHLPVGGKRYRPTLEDMIEFVVTEEMATPHEGWLDVVLEHRRRWELIQLKAAVRRDQEDAAEALRAEGWSVSAPQ